MANEQLDPTAGSPVSGTTVARGSGTGPKRRPDPRPMRIAFGVTGIAAFTALASAIVSPVPAASGSAGPTGAADAAGAGPGTAPAPTPAVVHVKRIITLAPGQTPPPQAVVTRLPAPSPRVVTIVTSQSGARP